MNNIEIHPFQQSDLDSIHKICLLTGDSGKDATEIFTDPKLIGYFYAAPYAVLEPELTFIETLNGMPSGYILGTKDSVLFEEKCKTEWFPKLRETYPFQIQMTNPQMLELLD